MKRTVFGLAVVCSMLTIGPANAALVGFQQYTGKVGLSTDGFGSTSQSGSIQASAPAGSTVIAAYLYSSLYSASAVPGGTFAGQAVNYATALGANGTLQAWRADVTSIVKSVIDGGAGGVYNFDITETSGNQDGEALVVVYTDPNAPVQTVALYNGFSASAGDSFNAAFANPLNPLAVGFVADMRLGIGFGFNPNGSDGSGGQFSTVDVNGTRITNVAGNFDDGAGADGALITVGGYDDPYSAMLPNLVADDHERYNIAPQIAVGDTLVSIRTQNPSSDDNIFLAAFLITGEGKFDVNPTPEPATYLSLATGLGLLALARRRRQRNR